MKTTANQVRKELEELHRLAETIKSQQNLQKQDLSFIESVRRFGTTDRGDIPTFEPWRLELLELISDFRINLVLTTGAAQIGKTQPHTWLICWLVSKGYNVLWTYAQERMLNRNVPVQFRPVVKSWCENANLTPSPQKSQNNTLYQINKGNAIFTYVNQPQNKNTRAAAAGSSVVSVSADCLIMDERSQYPPGTADPVYRRLDNSRITSHPVRELGTSGNGKGIEANIQKADLYFYPHINCKHCGETIRLDPKGCLLQKTKITLPNGEKKESYLSESGKPIKWFHSNPEDAVKTAFFGCIECGGQIGEERIESSFFKCIYTGTILEDYLRNEISDEYISVGINLSPLLRRCSFNLAADIIRSGLESSNAEDWQQQRLGHPSESVITSVTMKMIERCLNAPFPKKEPDFAVAGIDQGRSEHWLVILDVFLPDGWQKMRRQEKIDKAIRVIRFAGGIIKSEIPSRLKSEYHCEYNAPQITYGIIDNEPDIDAASRLCEVTCLEMADQKSGQLEELKKAFVVDGGVQYPCHKIRNEKFLKQVLTGFGSFAEDGHPVYRLPQHFQRWANNPSERSPFIHWQKPNYDPDSGKWKRDSTHLDDIYYATMFAEAAITIHLSKPRNMWGLI